MATQELDPTVTHPDYDLLHKRYAVCEDAFTGDVKGYVPALPDQSKEQWQDYVDRPAYFNVVGPTTSALVGAMTRKEYVLTGYSEFPANDLKSGNAFIAANLRDLLLGARVCILVTVENGASKLVSYDADDVINWTDTFKVIKECRLVPDAKNPFKQVLKESWLELYLDENGAYQSRRWEKNAKGKFAVEDLETLTVNGAALDFIPLFVSTPYDNTWDLFSPPLHTQASLNIQHFKQAVDLAHYAHWMAIPTFTISGEVASSTVDGETTTAEVKIGSTTQALHLASDASASFTEVSGASFSMLQAEMKNVEERMFVSGSRLISNKKGIESAEALHLRSGSESATLETIVTALEGAMNGALEVCGLIDRVPNPSIELNRDFTAMTLEPAYIKSLLELSAAGKISDDELTAKLIQGEVISPTVA